MLIILSLGNALLLKCSFKPPFYFSIKHDHLECLQSTLPPGLHLTAGHKNHYRSLMSHLEADDLFSTPAVSVCTLNTPATADGRDHGTLPSRHTKKLLKTKHELKKKK